VPPIIENEKAEKTFRLILPKERLLTEAQLLAQASLGVSLSEHEAAVFAYLTRKGQIDLADVKGLTGLNGPAAQALIQRLTVQALLAPAGDSHNLFSLAEHLRPQFSPMIVQNSLQNQGVISSFPAGAKAEQVTEQVTEQVRVKQPEHVATLVQLSAVQWAIVEHADTPRTLNELLALTGYKQRPHFKAQHLEPLLNGGVVRMTVPDKPTSSRQQYVLTEAGVKLKAMHGKAEAARKQETEQ
jgi:ATP-dependent DNA helicase RecG